MTHQIVVRVPDALLDALQRDAEENGRTLAQTVRFLLRKSFPADRVFVTGDDTGGHADEPDE